MEQPRPEIDTETIEDARLVIDELNFGEYADHVISFGGQEMTIVQGLARHWDEALAMSEEDLRLRIAMYVQLAASQPAKS